jgi:hypothetical protein
MSATLATIVNRSARPSAIASGTAGAVSSNNRRAPAGARSDKRRVVAEIIECGERQLEGAMASELASHSPRPS